MASAGGFGPELRASTAELTYWQLTGGFEPGKATPLFKSNETELQAAIDRAIGGLERLIDQYDEPDRCYLAQPHPAWTPRFSDHAQLARVAEWQVVAEEDDETVITPRAEAEANQLAASDPAVSAFVAASAGSGKTRLLTDRLLRLMLGGAKPERILCLTFTKAAAAEMAVRLQRRLGHWVALPGRRPGGRVAGTGHRSLQRDDGAGAVLVRPRAGFAGRDANRHDPCVLPVAVAPVSA